MLDCSVVDAEIYCRDQEKVNIAFTVDGFQSILNLEEIRKSV